MALSPSHEYPTWHLPSLLWPWPDVASVVSLTLLPHIWYFFLVCLCLWLDIDFPVHGKTYPLFTNSILVHFPYLVWITFTPKANWTRVHLEVDSIQFSRYSTVITVEYQDHWMLIFRPLIPFNLSQYCFYQLPATFSWLSWGRWANNYYKNSNLVVPVQNIPVLNRPIAWPPV